MIVGNDVSEFQGQIDWPTYKDNSNFVIIKASEGNGYIDKWFGNNRTQVRQVGLPHGFYHFARPDLGNSPQVEAEFFCKLIDGDPIREGEVLALDFEVSYNDPVNWCKAWLDAVAGHFNGLEPLIYLNQSLASNYDWTPVVNAGYGLWIAAYTGDPNNNNFNIGKFPSAAIQQWTDAQSVKGISGNVDGDCFFGDANAFGKYGYQTPAPVTPAPAPQSAEQPQTVQTNTASTEPAQTAQTSPSEPTITSQTATAEIAPTPDSAPVHGEPAPIDNSAEIKIIIQRSWSWWPFSSNFWGKNLALLRILVK